MTTNAPMLVQYSGAFGFFVLVSTGYFVRFKSSPLLIYFVIREGMVFLQEGAGASEGMVISESVSFSRGRVMHLFHNFFMRIFEMLLSIFLIDEIFFSPILILCGVELYVLGYNIIILYHAMVLSFLRGLWPFSICIGMC